MTVGGQILERPLHGDLPLHEDRDAIAHHLELAEQVAVEEDGPSLAPQLDEDVADLASSHRVDAVGRFVEDDQLRIVHQRLGESDPLLHPL